MGEAFYGRAQAYREALAAGSTTRPWRQRWRAISMADRRSAPAARLAAYMREAVRASGGAEHGRVWRPAVLRFPEPAAVPRRPQQELEPDGKTRANPGACRWPWRTCRRPACIWRSRRRPRRAPALPSSRACASCRGSPRLRPHPPGGGRARHRPGHARRSGRPAWSRWSRWKARSKRRSTSVSRLPSRAPAATAAEGHHAEPDDEEPPEPLIGGTVDLGALATEFLLLGIDPYPRKAGAEFAPPKVEDGGEHPFAALAALKKRLGGGQS